MRPIHYRVTSTNVTSMVVSHVQQALGLVDFGTRVRAHLLAQLLIAASIRRGSLSAACQDRCGLPSDETIRRALRANLPDDIAELEQQLASQLVTHVPRGIHRRPRPLAIDLTLIPFYGDPKTPGLFRGQAKQGTKYFWAFATCVIVRHGQRLTLGLVRVTSPGSLEKVIGQLLEQAAVWGVRPAYLLLDRGFYSAKVIGWLQEQELKFVMPMIRRGRKPDHPQGPTGTQVFFVPGRYGFGEHHWTGKRDRSKVTVSVAMVPHGRRAPLVYVFHGLNYSLNWYAQTYRRRFGIESSYRQLRQGLARTTTCDPRWRLMMVALALILRNFWVLLHWSTISDVRRGGRQFRFALLRVHRFFEWLRWAVDRWLPPKLEIFTQRPMPQPL
jgi:Transposase DDE domain